MLITGNNRMVVNNGLKRTDDGFYEMDLEDLERIFKTEHPAMMVLCNPHNPIGIAWPAEVQRQVAALARKYDVVVFSDEIHGDLVLKGHRHTSFLTVSDDARAVGVVMGAPSKTFNIAGIVSSWCVIKNPDLRKPFFHHLEANEQCSPNFLSMTASRAASKDSASFRPRTVACTPFHNDTAVGRESSSVSEAFLMSDLNCSRSLTVYASA
jgi:cystathionine beta-lyase